MASKQDFYTYLEKGCSVIPICSPRLIDHSEEICGGNFGKHPLIPWTEYQERRASKEEIDAWIKKFKDPNLAVICGEISQNLIVFDIEGYRMQEWEKWLEDEKIELPEETVMYKTGSGGFHIWLRTRFPVRKRVFPWGEIQASRTYVVVPPSIHKTGVIYQFVEGLGIESCPVAAAPPKIEETLLEPSASSKLKESEPLTEKLQSLKNLEVGERTNTLIAYGGRLVSKGLTAEEVGTILWSFNQQAEDPLSEQEFAQTILPGCQRFYLNEVKTRQQLIIRNREAEEKPKEDDWQRDPCWTFPNEVIRKEGDILGEWVWRMEKVREAPKHYFWFSLAQQLLTAVSATVKICDHLGNPILTKPKMYLLLSGDPGSKKSSSFVEVDQFFRRINADGAKYTAVFTASGSGEGILKLLQERGAAILFADEFKSILVKARQEGNTMIQTLITLFEQDEAEVLTKKQILSKAESVYLNFAACCTLNDLKTQLTTNMEMSGFLSRFFIVLGVPEKSVPNPTEMTRGMMQDLVVKFTDALRTYGSRFPLNGGGSADYTAKGEVRLQRTKEADSIYRSWYETEYQPSKESSKIRLDGYLRTFELILAVSRGKNKITADITEDAIKIITYQWNIRRFIWNSLQQTTVNDLSAKILEIVQKNPGVTYREVYQSLHAARRMEEFTKSFFSAGKK